MNSEAPIWPATGRDQYRVGSLALEGAAEVVRVFLPACLAPDKTAPWGAIARERHVTLEATTRWVDLVPEGERDQVYSMKWGQVPLDVVDSLRTGLADFEPVGTLDLVWWEGYADLAAHLSDKGAIPVEPADGRTRWHQPGYAIASHRTWADLEAVARFPGAHFPIAVLPVSRTYLIAQPLYSDSLFVSGPAGVERALAAGGLEVRSVGRDHLIPSMADTD